MNKIALVTGGNRGIGKAVCEQLAAKGFTVLLAARNEVQAQVVANELNKTLGKQQVHAISLDITSDASIEATTAFITANYPCLDVLVNNAGIFPDRAGDATNVSKEIMEKTMATNFYGAMWLSQALLPLLNKSEEGRIINVSSGMGALNGMGNGCVAYRISKTALNSLTAVMAADLTVAKSTTKVFSVCPGWVRTDMGGSSAHRSLEQGASGIFWLATEESAVSGKFYRDGKVIEW